ncbi:MAG: Holliday junction branch migration protein RuvA, partial [Propionibacteriales bacterium]|nr:Holliday junction branch migration protein RuvA [Propionibacteriales bacterium]
MIAELTGTVTSVGATRAVVDLNGFGVLVHVTPSTAAALRVGEATTVSTSLVVREESLTLYGFATPGEREMFELLLGANGVGPKLAQAALAVHGPDELRAAISSSNLAVLTAVPGIGRKGAERICIELRDKVNALSVGGDVVVGPAEGSPARESWREQVSEGL